MELPREKAKKPFEKEYVKGIFFGKSLLGLARQKTRESGFATLSLHLPIYRQFPTVLENKFFLLRKNNK